MPETPDFAQIATRIAKMMTALPTRDFDAEDVAAIADQFRLVWNARGAADIAKLDATVIKAEFGPAGVIVKDLGRALRGLDR